MCSEPGLTPHGGVGRGPTNLVSIGRPPGHTTRPQRRFHGKSAWGNGFRVTDVTDVTRGLGVSPEENSGGGDTLVPSGNGCGAQRRGRRLRIGRGGDCPADHEQVRAGGDRVGRGADPGLVVGGSAGQTDAGHDGQQM